MNPSPDRGKECLPPKKRESRQGSAGEQQHVPLDEFKPPVPLRSRSASGRGEGAREASDSDRALTNPNPHLLPSPPPPIPAPAPPGVSLPLPWHLAYSPTVPLPLFPGQERRGSGSPSWREDPLSSPLPHHSRWFRGEGPLRGERPLSLPPPPAPPPTSSASSSFKTPFPADSREMWSYFNSVRRDYSSALFSPSHLFSHPPLYPPDPGLAEGRNRYLQGKRPNGLDGPGSRAVSTSRLPLTGDYGAESSRTRLDAGPHGPHGSHANGSRRQQEEMAGRVHPAGPFFPDSHTQEGSETHSSLQDRDPHGTVKTGSGLLSASPHRLGPDPRAGRGGLLDSLGLPSEAQIYYSLGSVYNNSPHAPQAYPLYGPSGTPQYNLHSREPGPRTHAPRTSAHSPLSVLNSHERPQRDRERDRDQERQQERERDRDRHKDRDRDKERDHHHQDDNNKDRERDRDSERERRRERDHRGRESSPGGGRHSRPRASSPPGPRQSPPASLLPHFAKGSLIELASGRLKRVEELRTEDFLRSADTSPEFHLSTCTVLLIGPGNAHGFSHLQVLLTDRNTQELLKVLVEYPFFVRDRGWSSCCPQRTTQLYGLPCRQLAEGDVCLALTPTPPSSSSSSSHRMHGAVRSGSSRPHRAHSSSSARAAGGESSSSSHREEMPPPPPPPPLPHHLPAPPHPHPPPPPPPPPPPISLAPSPPVDTSSSSSAAERPPQTRKRRWSAPDTLPPTRTDENLPDLPHGSKQMKWQ